MRSILFDRPDTGTLRAKLERAKHREEFKIRYYHGDPDSVFLEKKVRCGRLIQKTVEPLSRTEAEKIFWDDTGWMARDKRLLLTELHAAMACHRLRPQTVVDCVREPFRYAPGNVQVTLDGSLRMGTFNRELLKNGIVMLPVKNEPVLMEVKYDEFLPDVIACIVQLGARTVSAFSGCLTEKAQSQSRV